MYLVVIAWMYVALMMAVAEATNTNGTILGAVITFVLYGLGPMALVLYLMGTPGRRRALRKKEQEERAAYLAARQATHADASHQPDSSSEPARAAESTGVSPVGKESS